MLPSGESPQEADAPLEHAFGGEPRIPSGAAGPGFEPGYLAPKANVLPLDDPAAPERISSKNF